jgi:hypothetical protein
VPVPVKDFSDYFRTKVLPALPVLGPDYARQFRVDFYSMLARGGIDCAPLSEPPIESVLSSEQFQASNAALQGEVWGVLTRCRAVIEQRLEVLNQVYHLQFGRDSRGFLANRTVKDLITAAVDNFETFANAIDRELSPRCALFNQLDWSRQPRAAEAGAEMYRLLEDLRSQFNVWLESNPGGSTDAPGVSVTPVPPVAFSRYEHCSVPGPGTTASSVARPRVTSVIPLSRYEEQPENNTEAKA